MNNKMHIMCNLTSLDVCYNRYLTKVGSIVEESTGA